MTFLLIILLLFEILSFLTLKDHFSRGSRSVYYGIMAVHSALSLAMWLYALTVIFFKGHADDPEYINKQLIFSGLLSAILIPRMLLCFLHFTGKLLRIKKGGHSRLLTGSGLIFSGLIFLVVVHGSYTGRYNFRTEEVTVRLKNLDPSLDGLVIAQLSDLHLSSFFRHPGRLDDVMKRIEKYQPDLIINTGDFVTVGSREFTGFDTILSKYRGRYGNYAILGNHDMGTYFPPGEKEEKRMTPVLMDSLISASGYRVLNDENDIIDIHGVKVAVMGITTSGRHPRIIHGDIGKAISGTGSAGLKILLCHDPNQWDSEVAGRTDIQLSLAGHTHGMQIGIITRKYRWSPAAYYYPRWNGLYSEGNQYLYVNRGLGVLGIPFRLGMPPEITIITLRTG